MSPTPTGTLGSVLSLWRYPVKSMMGEELRECELTARGLAGDRAYALVDDSDGKVATAKNPKKWPTLFQFHAAFVAPPSATGRVPPVRITLPDGSVVASERDDASRRLSHTLNRKVTLTATEAADGSASASSTIRIAEEYWPDDVEGLNFHDKVTDFPIPGGTFFDAAFVHLITTATLAHLSALYPSGRFEAQRFRPNIIVALPAGQHGFVENDWVGHTLSIGDAARLTIISPCGRCVMTTLAQGDLPKDPGILRTAARHNQVRVGVYAAVEQVGAIRRGDPVRVTA